MTKGTHTDPPGTLESNAPLSPAVLRHQNRVFRHTRGVSQENAQAGFAPAFLDTETGTVYPSRFADGNAAPLHVLDGLPEELVVSRNGGGAVREIKGSVIAGFLRDGRFFTRGQAAHWLDTAEPS